MPRNGSSVYSLPAGNPVISGTIIATTWANTTLTDIATALTNSLSTDGSTASPSLAGKTMSGGTFSGPTVTGILTLTGGQIAFPAVQVPSANVNTLDDYEEGTWTPVLTFAVPGNVNVIYSTQGGDYTKVGNRVDYWWRIVTTTFTHTTSTGNLQITGLPFTSVVTTGLSEGSFRSSGLTVAIGTSFDSLTASLSAGSALLEFTISAVGGGNSATMTTGNHTTGNNMVNVGHIVMRTT